MARKKASANAYAVIEAGGKQHLVRAGDVLEIEKIPGEPGQKVELRPVLALSDGKKLQLGAPALEKAKVTSTLVDQIRGKKVVAFKKKRRKGYSRKAGHRQALTVVRVEKIG
jgi:large subunit ribosomal protein L21